MSLTSVDFLMCLGRYTYGELADNIEPGDYSERYPRELLTSVRGGARIWLSAVEGHRTTTLLPFGPWSRHPLQLWNKSLSSCCWRNRWSLPNPALPFSHYLFYSLLILLLYLLLQTRPNQQYLNTTNDHRGFSTEFLLVDIDNSVSSLRVLSEMRRKSELWFSTCPLPGTVLDWRIDYSLITEL